MKELYSSPDTIIFTSPLPSDLFFENILQQSNILDMGCGYGRVLKYLFESGYSNLTGVDCSDNLIIRAKDYFPFANYYVDNITHFQTNEKFDCIILCGVLEYITDKKERTQLINKMFDLLNIDGCVFIESFLIDKHYIRHYIKNLIKKEQWGTIYAGNTKLFHANSTTIDNLFKIRFRKECSEKHLFHTWKGNRRKGYIAIYKKIITIQNETERLQYY
ncbi:hypothetical protein FACS1894199_12820 [Bacteroidia bacterium]|nr:hypothetical protein FACS1894199_12820 [Bacteroidia bacterium]